MVAECQVGGQAVALCGFLVVLGGSSISCSRSASCCRVACPSAFSCRSTSSPLFSFLLTFGSLSCAFSFSMSITARNKECGDVKICERHFGPCSDARNRSRNRESSTRMSHHRPYERSLCYCLELKTKVNQKCIDLLHSHSIDRCIIYDSVFATTMFLVFGFFFVFPHDCFLRLDDDGTTYPVPDSRYFGRAHTPLKN